MIRGQYLSSRDNIGDVLSVRVAIPEFGGQGRDENDDLARYVVLYNDENAPFGCGRLYLNEGGAVVIDGVGVLPEYRRLFYGDLIMGMLLSRARALDAPAILARVPESLIPYFSRYGFEASAECEDICGQPARVMRILSNRIRLESACAHDDVPMCTGDCAHCKRHH